MGMINVKGNTFYLRGGTHTGVYILKDNKAIIIDGGRSGLNINKIIKSLNAYDLELKYILNTHEHDDHTGVNYDLINEYKNVELMMSNESKLYIENPELFSKYIIGGKSNDAMDGKVKSKYKGITKVNHILEEGIINIDNEEFEVISLKGHTLGSIGILTPDKVFFVGDSLIGGKLLSKYDFLFLYDIEEQIKTLDKIESIEYGFLILGHGENILTKDESKVLVENNRKAVYKYINQVLKYLEEPMGIELLLKHIITDNDLSCNYREYHYFKTSLVSLISYLLDLQKIEYILKDGELRYYNIQKY